MLVLCAPGMGHSCSIRGRSEPWPDPAKDGAVDGGLLELRDHHLRRGLARQDPEDVPHARPSQHSNADGHARARTDNTIVSIPLLLTEADRAHADAPVSDRLLLAPAPTPLLTHARVPVCSHARVHAPWQLLGANAIPEH